MFGGSLKQTLRWQPMLLQTVRPTVSQVLLVGYPHHRYFGTSPSSSGNGGAPSKNQESLAAPTTKEVPNPSDSTSSSSHNEIKETKIVKTDDNVTKLTDTAKKVSTDHATQNVSTTKSAAAGASESASKDSASADPNKPTTPSWLDKTLHIWNERSGTSEVLHLKELVSKKSQAFDAATVRVTNARRKLDDCTLQWERTSGTHLQLLQRRDSWTSADAQHFASIVSKEVECRNNMDASRNELVEAEAHLSKCQLEYMNAMRQRYHEEQVWQDQWRVLGTYGTWSLIVLNSCVFLASQAFQYRREARRMEHLEDMLQRAREPVTTAVATGSTTTTATDSVATTPTTTQASETKEEATGETFKSTAKEESTQTETSVQSSSTAATGSAVETKEEEEDKSSALEESVFTRSIKRKRQATHKPIVTAESNQEGEDKDDSKKDETSTKKSIIPWLPADAFSTLSTQAEWAQVQLSQTLFQWQADATEATKDARVASEEFLKELHVPSAVFGASVAGCLCLVAATLLLPSSRS